jgi:prepilin-type N-terminal cleavage/methylation domain-containing protein
MRRTIHPGSRGGFTLVELLVVVTIIAVLIALISSGVMAALSKGTEVNVRSEVSQLTAAVQAFKGQFQVQFIPDRMILPPVAAQGDDPATQKLVSDTQVFLKSVWTRLDPVKMASGQYWQVGKGRHVLHGDQVLVWALGGWRDLSTNNVYGFSTDATDPMKPYTAGQQRHGPFFEGFTAERLRTFAMPSNAEIKTLPKRAINFPSFVDYYGKVPYLYFSSGKAGNDYSYEIAAPTPDPNNYIKVAPYALSVTQVSPTQTIVKFANPSGFQIVCAGKDNVFGPGGLTWGGSNQPVLTAEVKDDLANFSATKLGD